MSNAAVPSGFKISKSMLDRLPQNERAGAAEYLWEKSEGLCPLCDEPLPADGKRVDPDHRLASMEGEGGVDKLSNLYLAHRECNSTRKNMPFKLASQLIQFKKWWLAHSRPSFDDVIDRYVKDGNLPVRVREMSNQSVTVAFGPKEVTAPLWTDPATETKYFFMDVPVRYILNDTDTQPRLIEQDHVWKLAADFYIHPVHEPSNCRMVPTHGDVYQFLQFDGQHKTTAQIVLGREQVPMKLYVDPDAAMLQELVVQIQQGIRKRPLSTTDTLRKLDQVIQDKVNAYKHEHEGKAPSEAELVAAQPKQDQNSFKRNLLSNLEFAVLNDDRFHLRDYQEKKSTRSKPLTDSVLVRKLIKPLVTQELLEEPLDNAVQRDSERDTIIDLLNQIADHMLDDKWNPKPSNEEEDLDTRRARNFFYQGAIGWWMGDVLLPAIKTLLPYASWKQPFLRPLDADTKKKVQALVTQLCSWPIWGSQDDEVMAAFRSNTVSRVAKAFPDYDNARLLKDVTSG